VTRNSVSRVLVSVVMVFAICSPVAQAGTIVSSGQIVGPGLGTAAVNTITTGSPNNVGFTGVQPPNPNQLAITKTFQQLDYMDIEFNVANTAGPAPANNMFSATEYFLRDTVTNQTGQDWFDFHFRLGFNVGANFIPSNLVDFLCFDCYAGENAMGDPVADFDPVPTSGSFTRLVHGQNEINWSRGVVPNGGATIFTLSLDVPNFHAGFPAGVPVIPVSTAFPNGGYRFTLRQIPTVPALPRTCCVLLVCCSLACERG
jgi:hypothetical protein